MLECPIYQGIQQQQPWMQSGSIRNLQGFMGCLHYSKHVISSLL